MKERGVERRRKQMTEIRPLVIPLSSGCSWPFERFYYDVNISVRGKNAPVAGGNAPVDAPVAS